MNTLIANFGNDSVALIEYAKALKLENVSVVSVDTGFASPTWNARVNQAEPWVKSLGFNWVRLYPKLDFSALVKAQGEFPSRRFQWCATYLKGDTFRTWLNEADPLRKALILLARRRSQSSKFADLPEFSEGLEEFEARRVWHPLYAMRGQEIQKWIKRTPFSWLTHRSLECDPCVNSDARDVLRLSKEEVARVSHLEIEMNEPFLPHLCHDKKKLAEALPELKAGPPQFLFDMGCGSPYGCGL